MITTWTVGTVATFALMLATDRPRRVARMSIAVRDITMPIWCIHLAIALSCVALWPVLLGTMVWDEVKTW